MVIYEAIVRLDEACDMAEQFELVAAAWKGMLALRGWDGVDSRCRLDNPAPYR